MMLDYLLTLNALNLAVSAAVAWTCVCRMTLMNKQTKLLIRLAYTFIFVCAWANGFRGPMFGVVLTQPFPILGGLCVLMALVTESGAWGGFRAPHYVQRRHWR